MFDTVALSQTSFRRPDRDLLARFRATCQGGRGYDDAYRIFINPTDTSHEPRITITRKQNNQYIYRSEASIGAWCFGSNLHLPSIDDILDFLDAIDEFVGERTGLILEARTARVARLDVTRDFRADPSVIPAIIDHYRHFDFPKRNTILINGTTVNFDARGKKLSRRASLYSKYHERLDKNATDSELEMAAGIVRLDERYLINQAVSELSKSLGLRNHSAETMLTEHVHTTVMNRLVATLGIEKALERDHSRVPTMYSDLGHLRAGRIMAHLALERVLGKEYHLDPVYDVSQRTAKQRSREATRFGLIRLE